MDFCASATEMGNEIWSFAPLRQNRMRKILHVMQHKGIMRYPQHSSLPEMVLYSTLLCCSLTDADKDWRKFAQGVKGNAEWRPLWRRHGMKQPENMEYGFFSVCDKNQKKWNMDF